MPDAPPAIEAPALAEAEEDPRLPLVNESQDVGMDALDGEKMSDVKSEACSDLDRETWIMGECSPRSDPDEALSDIKEWDELDIVQWQILCKESMLKDMPGLDSHAMWDDYWQYAWDTFAKEGPKVSEYLAEGYHFHDWVFAQKQRQVSDRSAKEPVKELLVCPCFCLHVCVSWQEAHPGSLHRGKSVNNIMYDDSLEDEKKDYKPGASDRTPDLTTPQAMKALGDVLDSFTPPKVGVQTVSRTHMRCSVQIKCWAP